MRYDQQSRTTQILLGEEVIGRLVTYGKKDVMRVSKSGFRPTVYNGRVTVNGHPLSIEASSNASLLNALATQIGKALREDKKASAKLAEPTDGPAAPVPRTAPKF
ncbi:hypothetical protein [Rhizobium sp. BK176]|uniref:hypothetical protein n=1 Tax=Rhizobium sp. BK176 TaxID=2587071 RepID=UPI002167B503|nr:hypothetical protein [Rhizobium sp. BK176]MCS4090168.1 hypothetical protein [Rhizobium sp. BK176]